MGLKYVDDFSFWTTEPGTFTSSGNATNTAGIRVQTFNGGNSLVSNNFTAQGTYVCNFRSNWASAGGFTFYLLQSGSGAQCSLGFTGGAKFQFYRNDPGVPVAIGASSPLAIVQDAGVTYYDVEAKFVIGNSGSVELRVNGGVQIGPSTVDNQVQAVSTANYAYCGFSNSGDTSGPMRSQHMIVMDGSGAALNGGFLGPVNVEFLPPTGDGFYQDWAFTGAASAWEAVNDLNPDEDTSYIFSNVVGEQSTFTHDPLDAASTAVKATAIWTRARRDDSTTRAFKNLLRNGGGTDDLGTVEHFVGEDYIWFFQPYEVSPFTAVAWTVSEVNNCEYGVELTT